jgi:hypothetical protein
MSNKVNKKSKKMSAKEMKKVKGGLAKYDASIQEASMAEPALADASTVATSDALRRARL